MRDPESASPDNKKPVPSVTEWPDNVAEIYREIAEEDRKLAEAMVPASRETLPIFDKSPVRSEPAETED